MAFSGFNSGGGGSAFGQTQPLIDGQFDIFEWHEKFQSCVKYFLDHAQYTSPVQAVAAFINIQLPHQRSQNSTPSSRPNRSPSGPSPVSGMPGSSRAGGNISLSQLHSRAGQGESLAHSTLIPYIRRLVATGFDNPAILHGFFGDNWAAGVGPLHETERRNYLFAAKSDNWLKVKSSYDMDDNQMIPFIRPLRQVTLEEIQSAENNWSEWLAMQDWMLGPRAPEDPHTGHPRHEGGVNIKREDRD